MTKAQKNVNDEPQSQSIPGTTDPEPPNESTEGGNSHGDTPGASQGNVVGGGSGDTSAAPSDGTARQA